MIDPIPIYDGLIKAGVPKPQAIKDTLRACGRPMSRLAIEIGAAPMYVTEIIEGRRPYAGVGAELIRKTISEVLHRPVEELFPAPVTPGRQRHEAA